MKKKILEILENSFYQILIIYTLLVLLISFNLIERFTLHFEILAIILGFFGLTLIFKSEVKSFQKINKIFFIIFFSLSIIFIFISHYLPYVNNEIPLGYDAGIYKYAIEHGLTNLDKWVVAGIEPGFLYLMKLFTLIFSIEFILIYLLIFFCILLGISVYLVSKEFFNNKIALISLIIYSVSLIQYKTFAMMYYKNILGLSLMLFSFYFIKKSMKNKSFLIPAIIFAGFLGGIHRPTFYIFGLSFFVYAFLSPFNKEKKYEKKQLLINILTGIIILAIALIFYAGIFSDAITIMFQPVLKSFIEPGKSPGTFISFFEYQFYSLAYLPFAILGFFYLIKKRDFNILFFWLIINSTIVYFQFFFFNRFIIHLDIALIIFSSIGFYVLIKNKKTLGVIILILMVLASGIILIKTSIAEKPIISANDLSVIKNLVNTPNNSYVMALNSRYSPFVLGYSNRKTIAPGLFDYDTHNNQEWDIFWTTSNLTYINQFMNAYKKPLYVFLGEKDVDNLGQYTDCFKLYYISGKAKIYEYTC